MVTINWKKDLIMHINIVQPGLSCSNPSQDILNILGCVASYIKDVSNIDLHVYCNLLPGLIFMKFIHNNV